jgi:hypothetical protein
LADVMSRTTKTSLVFLGVFIALVVFLSTRMAPVECEVCMRFADTTVCRKAASGTRKAAVESAVTSACGTLAGGMTETIRCQNTTPESVTCNEAKN